jgi:hypothetical protein
MSNHNFEVTSPNEAEVFDCKFTWFTGRRSLEFLNRRLTVTEAKSKCEAYMCCCDLWDINGKFRGSFGPGGAIVVSLNQNYSDPTI